MNVQPIAAFDMDGTVVAGQTQLIFVKHLYARGSLSPGAALAVLSWFIRWRLGLSPDPRGVRRRVLADLRGVEAASLEKELDMVFWRSIAPRIRPRARQTIRMLEAAGVRTVLVSAAAAPLVARVAAGVGASGAIGTEARQEGGRYTGDLAGPIIDGSEKTAGLARWADERYGRWTLRAAYGDSSGDEALLATALKAYVVRPDRAMRDLAARHGWEVLDW